jgi:hypothetical protein
MAFGIKWNNHKLNRSGFLTSLPNGMNFLSKQSCKDFIASNGHIFGKKEEWLSEYDLELRGLSKEGREKVNQVGKDNDPKGKYHVYKVEADYTYELVDLDKDQEYQKKIVQAEREKEYAKQGCTSDKMIIALWEFVIEGKQENLKEIQTKRVSIKESIPHREVKR